MGKGLEGGGGGTGQDTVAALDARGELWRKVSGEWGVGGGGGRWGAWVTLAGKVRRIEWFVSFFWDAIVCVWVDSTCFFVVIAFVAVWLFDGVCTRPAPR